MFRASMNAQHGLIETKRFIIYSLFVECRFPERGGIMKYRAMLIWLVFLAFSAQAVTVVPGNLNISYTGRWDTSDSSAPWAYWKGSSIIANFEGSQISATFSAGSTDYFRVIIDGDAVGSWKIPASSSVATHVLASGLGDGIHQLEIVKETDVGRWTFRGFEIIDGTLSDPPDPPEQPSHKMVFYGDSNLAGYSLESERNESAKSLQGSYYGYAGVVSRMFDAEYHNISRSGATIRSLNNAFDRLDYWSRSPTWDFSRFIADVVVVNVGANDVGRPKKRIMDNYHALLDDLRAAHPYAHIMLYNAWGWDYDEPANYINEVIDERDDINMSYAVFPWIFEQWHGCEYDHAGMAQVLADHLSAEMGWSQGTRDVMSGYGVNGNVANGGFEEVAPFGGYGWRYYTDAGVSRVNNSGAHSGEFYLRLTEGAASHQPTPARAGDRVSVAMWMRGDGAVNVTIDFRDQEMWTTPLHTDTRVMTLSEGWSEYTMSATAPTGTARAVYHTRLTFTAAPGATAEIDDVVMSVTGGNGDTDPPTPDPMTWESVPSASSETSISMTATSASDPSGVEYLFECVSGSCASSGWQDGATYTDNGLLAGSTYAYRVQARDKSANQNTTGFSSTETATPGGCMPSQSHVKSIVVSKSGVDLGRKRGRAVVTVNDNCGFPVAGAKVSGTFTGDYGEQGSESTTDSGVATFVTSAAEKGKISFTFCVEDIVDAGLTYDSDANSETCDSL